MKAFQLDATHEDLSIAIQSLRIVEKPIPKPQHGQVLVKVEGAPCNPSDLLFLQGRYGGRKKLPKTPGWEGSGVVIESGGGVLAWYLKGKRVACSVQSDSDGTWSEYLVVDAKTCIVLNDQIPFEQGACLIINPLTAIGMVERGIKGGHKAMIQTAACSQVGKMIQVLAKRNQIPLINIVRRNEQKEELLSIGEKWIINSEDPDFLVQLKEQAQKLGATIAFDAVGGGLTGKILEAMPPASKMLVYGALSGAPCKEINPMNLIFEKKTLEGFWLKEWVQNIGILHRLQLIKLVQKLMGKGELRTKIQKCVGFEEWKATLLEYTQKMTEGKVILKP